MSKESQKLTRYKFKSPPRILKAESTTEIYSLFGYVCIRCLNSSCNWNITVVTILINISLFLQFISGHSEVLVYLLPLLRKTTSTLRNNKGQTPLDMALLSDQETCSEIIRTFEGDTSYNCNIQEKCIRITNVCYLCSHNP